MNDRIESSELRRPVDQVLDDLQKATDELRVQLHLASMEAKDEWQRLEPRIDELERKAEKLTGTAKDELESLGRDLMARVKRIRTSID